MTPQAWLAESALECSAQDPAHHTASPSQPTSSGRSEFHAACVRGSDALEVRREGIGRGIAQRQAASTSTSIRRRE